MNKLETMLKQIFDDACQREQIPQKRKMGGGLHISLTVDSRSKITLTIARDNVYPSMQEWKTVCKYFPYYIGTPEPVYHMDRDGRKAFSAQIPSRQAVAQKLL
jgi:hypothetical protein